MDRVSRGGDRETRVKSVRSEQEGHQWNAPSLRLPRHGLTKFPVNSEGEPWAPVSYADESRT